MSQIAKSKDLRGKSKDDLLKQLTDFKKELSQFRAAQKSGSNRQTPTRIRTVRKNIARVLTVLSQKERTSLRAYYAEKGMRSKTPKGLREKLTHRRRLALKKSEKNRKTRHQLRMSHRFPRRVYAVKI